MMNGFPPSALLRKRGRALAELKIQNCMAKNSAKSHT